MHEGEQRGVKISKRLSFFLFVVLEQIIQLYSVTGNPLCTLSIASHGAHAVRVLTGHTSALS